MNIVIAFHIPISSNVVKSATFLDQVFDDAFDKDASRIDLGNEITEEIMYAVARPILATEEVMEEYFKKLLFIFTITMEYLPHFTQMPNEILEKGMQNG